MLTRSDDLTFRRAVQTAIAAGLSSREFMARCADHWKEEMRERTTADARAILRNAATHGRLAVDDCNGTLDERGERRRVVAEVSIKNLCQPYGFTPIFGGDPRGFTVKLRFPSGIYNTWGGRESGYGVPQR